MNIQVFYFEIYAIKVNKNIMRTVLRRNIRYFNERFREKYGSQAANHLPSSVPGFIYGKSLQNASLKYLH